jgi:hypothetical protein
MKFDLGRLQAFKYRVIKVDMAKLYQRLMNQKCARENKTYVLIFLIHEYICQ